MNKKILSLIAIIVLLLPSFSGCVAYENFVNTFFRDDGELIRIGVFEPLSGTYSKYGALERTGIELAHDLYPEVDGKSVQLVFSDNESNIKRARSVAKELIKENVSVVLGSYDSTLSIAGGEVFQEAGVPAIAITNTNPVVTDAFDIYCRVCPVESDQGAAAAAYAVDNLRADTVAVFKEKDDDFSDTLARTFSDAFTAAAGTGGAIVLTEEYEKGQTDFQDQMMAVKASGATAVFFPSSWQMGIDVMAEAEKVGVTATFLGTDKWRTDEMLASYQSGAMPPMAFTTYYNESARMTKMSTVFLDAYKEKYGEDSVPDPAIALAFDAYLVALESVRAAGSSDDYGKILSALHATKSFAGASGEITFDDAGNPIKPITMATVINGKFVSIDSVKPGKEKGDS
ncbi:MAG: ABC transporter substrate-binding protein [Clostridiales Family XIII bacterium]|jgi:branched-chain amino acid transport system substrate-binding protein|nr:ABC transporter substrate-binding protein [Clostridiales Family XIII bacterium]